MDGFDLVATAAVAQTLVLTVTLIVFILQLRSQTKATKDAAYQSVLNDYKRCHSDARQSAGTQQAPRRHRQDRPRLGSASAAAHGG